MLVHVKNGIEMRYWSEMKKKMVDMSLRREGFGGLQSVRGESGSSKRFKRRAETDPYGKTRARQRGERVYVARSAHKLLEMDRRYGLFPRHSTPACRLPWRVLEFGAAPGGWTEVVLERLARLLPPRGALNPYHHLITCDLEPLNYSIAAQVPAHISLTHIQDDMRSLETAATIARLLSTDDTRAMPTVILSDMLAAVTGLPTRDAAQSFDLAQQVITLSRSIVPAYHASPLDFLIIKHLQSEFTSTLKAELLLDWSDVRWAKPPACRSESREGYFLARRRKNLASSVQM